MLTRLHRDCAHFRSQFGWCQSSKNLKASLNGSKRAVLKKIFLHPGGIHDNFLLNCCFNTSLGNETKECSFPQTEEQQKNTLTRLQDLFLHSLHLLFIVNCETLLRAGTEM